MLLLQQFCSKVQNLCQSSALKVVSVPVSGFKLLCNVSTGVLRPLVPEPMRRAVFESIHKVSHSGKQAYRRLISRSFVWEFLSRHVKLILHQFKLTSRLKFTISRFQDEDSPTFMWTWLDLSLIYHSMRCLEAIPLQFTTAEDCARVLLHSWIPLFRVPSVITSDRGALFTGSIWLSSCNFLGIIHSPTTSFHSQSNRIVERLHRQLKVFLRAQLAGSDWFHHLPLVLLGLRSVPRED